MYGNDRGLGTKFDIPSLAREVAVKIGPDRRRFYEDGVRNYQQLRLFFDRSRADGFRDTWRKRGRGPLEPNFEGLALLNERLREGKC